MIEVTCAIIVQAAKVLAAQRSGSMDLPGQWEFPGGKIEPGETAEACIVREIKEELGLDIRVQSSLTPVEHHYPSKSIRLIPFVCEVVGGELVVLEHARVAFFKKEELMGLNWAAADLVLLEQLP